MQCRPRKQPRRQSLFAESNTQSAEVSTVSQQKARMKTRESLVTIATMNLRSIINRIVADAKEAKHSRNIPINDPVPDPVLSSTEPQSTGEKRHANWYPSHPQLRSTQKQGEGRISHYRRTFNHISNSDTISQLLSPLDGLLFFPHISHPTQANITHPPILRIPSP